MSDVMGNDQVLTLLEYCLNEAKTKQIDYAAVVLHENPNLLGGGRAGLAWVEPDVANAMREAADAIMADVKSREKPPTNPNLDASYFAYNVMTNACSFDFPTFLVVAEMRRRKANAPSPLKVGFWRGANGQMGLDDPKRRQFFFNVMKPIVPMMGVEDDAAVYASEQITNNAGDIVDMYHEGVEVPYFKPSEQDLADVKYYLRGIDNIITITLRETDTWSFRNSNLEAWKQFAQELRDQGYNVIFLRDTAISHNQIGDGFTIYPKASELINLRLALYSMAKANLMISNGPASCTYISPWPYLLFIDILPNDHWYFPNTEKNWIEKMKVPPGTQYPWAKDNQRIFWGKDTLDNIRLGWSQIEPAISRD